MEKTVNYQLNQWDAADPIRREDFNADNAALDAALAAIKSAAEEDVQSLSETVAALTAGLGSGGQNARVTWGSYTGTGKYGSGNPNSLTFDFVPVVVFIGCTSFSRYQAWPTVAIRGAEGMHCDSATGMTTQCYVTWSENGLSWYHTDCAPDQNNNSGSVYYYAALGYSA